MPLQGFIDNSTPVVSAAWLNAIDAFYTTLFGSSTTAAAARAALGSTTVGDAVFIATTAALARAALGSTTVGDAVFIAASAAAARSAMSAAGSGAVTGSGLTQTTARMLGRTTAATGAIEELTVGAGLSLAAGALVIAQTPVTNSLGADVALNNTANFFDGPSIALGATGTWFASGTVSLLDTAGAAAFYVKLWDGTTVIASAVLQSSGASAGISCALSGTLATPASNIRISARDLTSTSGKLAFNTTGTSKDCTVTALRVA